MSAVGSASHELEAEIGQQGGNGDPDCCPEEFRALGKFSQGIDGDQSGHELRHDEREGLRQDYRRSKYGDDVRDEGCPGVEEDAEHYRQHAIGHEIDAGPHVSHDGIGDDGEDEEEGHDEQNGAKAVEVVAAELLEIQ